ncbi:MAG: hypothetical protein IJU71_07220, partial [Selenomonadaceae bacterium]|nr:hypothetical protein [Selenomonadaceae bacterium]
MVSVLIWGTDDLFPQLAPYYFHYAQQGLMSIVGFGVYTGGLTLFKDLNGTKLESNPKFERVILSTKNNFYDRMKQLEGMGIPRKIIIDGAVFKIQGLDFKNFIETGKVVAKWDSKMIVDGTYAIYPRTYHAPQFNMSIGIKSSLSLG